MNIDFEAWSHATMVKPLGALLFHIENLDAIIWHPEDGSYIMLHPGIWSKRHAGRNILAAVVTKGFAATLAVGLLLAAAGCSSSTEDIRSVADESIATALAAVPTVTPVPTATPQPSPTEQTIPATPTPFSLPPAPTPLPTSTPVTFAPTATPQPTSTPQPTATPQPTPTPVIFPPTPTPASIPTPTTVSPSGVTAVGGQASGPDVFRLPGDFSLKVDPAEPLSGLDITFTLTGLSPWQAITVAFIDPLGRPVGWVTENEVLLVGAGDVPIIERSLYSNGSGDVSWIRIGSKDREGTWTLQVNIDGESNTITYPVAQLQLPPQDSETVGVELSRYQGSASNTFYSTLVPVATAVNLQAHLAWVVDRLAEELGVQSSQIPNIYLTGNQNLLQQVARATGDEIGFEDGYYRSSGTRPGIFMRTNLFRTGVQGILTHEYTHLLLQEVALDQSLPSWLNEGLSRHTEYGIGLQGARPNAVKVALFRSADLAQAAVLSGALPPLTSLESQTDWNAQSDDYLINLQYAEAYMAVQYMAETYGTSAPIEVVQAIGRGSQLSGAIPEVTGRQYRDFRQSFVEWLQDWEDPERAQIRSYLDSLEPILDSLNSISARRAVDLQSGASFSTRIPVKQGLVTDAQSLLDQLGELSPSDLLSDLHHEATTYLSRFVEWLTLDLGYIETFEDALLIRANGMIAEINARDAVLNRRVNSLNFVYNLA